MRTFCAVVLLADRPLSEEQRRWCKDIGIRIGMKRAAQEATRTGGEATAWGDPTMRFKQALPYPGGQYFLQNRPDVPHTATVPILPRIPSQKLAHLIDAASRETPQEQPIVVEPLPDGEDEDATQKMGALQKMAKGQA